MRWTLIAGAFVAGLALAAVGFHIAGAGIVCEMSDPPQSACVTNSFGEELVYSGLALLAVALLSAAVMAGRRS